jgi:hypothetical protein
MKLPEFLRISGTIMKFKELKKKEFLGILEIFSNFQEFVGVLG